MSYRKAKPPKSTEERPAEAKLVKQVEPSDIEQLLVQELGYSNEFLAKDRITRLRGFAAWILHKFRLPSWAALLELPPLVRLASLQLTDYPPPHGAMEYFEVCSFSPADVNVADLVRCLCAAIRRACQRASRQNGYS